MSDHGSMDNGPDEIEDYNSDRDDGDAFADSEDIIATAGSDQGEPEELEGPVQIDSIDDNVEGSTIEQSGTKNIKSVKLPLSRIKVIMKTDPNVKLVNQDALISTAKATELFVEFLTSQSYKFTSQSKRKMITAKDVESAILNEEKLSFLDGALDF